MLRFKLFSGEARSLEGEVNMWLSTFDPDVTEMVQTAGGDGNLTIAFLFEESFRGQERRLSAEHEAGREKPAIPAPRPTDDDPVIVPIEPGVPGT